jgi:hypothetical protein
MRIVSSSRFPLAWLTCVTLVVVPNLDCFIYCFVRRKYWSFERLGVMVDKNLLDKSSRNGKVHPFSATIDIGFSRLVFHGVHVKGLVCKR